MRSVAKVLKAEGFPVLPSHVLRAEDMEDIDKWARGLEAWVDKQVRACPQNPNNRPARARTTGAMRVVPKRRRMVCVVRRALLMLLPRRATTARGSCLW